MAETQPLIYIVVRKITGPGAPITDNELVTTSLEAATVFVGEMPFVDDGDGSAEFREMEVWHDGTHLYTTWLQDGGWLVREG